LTGPPNDPNDLITARLFTMKRMILPVLLLTVAMPIVTGAQSLAELARQEEARRKTVKPARKVYTNGDLKGDGAARLPSGPPTTAGLAPAAPGPGTATDEKPAGEDKEPARDQAYWGGRMAAARAAVERSRLFAEALQSRINALTADFVNRDDPAQRAQIELERQRSVAELERVKKEIEEQTKAIADIEEEARKAGVPPGWLR
jgi:hypothetical protein